MGCRTSPYGPVSITRCSALTLTPEDHSRPRKTRDHHMNRKPAPASATIDHPSVNPARHRMSSDENRCGYNPARSSIPAMRISRYGSSRPVPGCLTEGLLHTAATHQEINHAIHRVWIAETGSITMQGE